MDEWHSSRDPAGAMGDSPKPTKNTKKQPWTPPAGTSLPEPLGAGLRWRETLELVSTQKSKFGDFDLIS